MGRSGGFRPKAIRRTGSGGKMGVDIAPVELPSLEDYRPPAELREEVLRSMEESYPRSEERALKDYFERITQ